MDLSGIIKHAVISALEEQKKALESRVLKGLTSDEYFLAIGKIRQITSSINIVADTIAAVNRGEVDTLEFNKKKEEYDS